MHPRQAIHRLLEGGQFERIQKTCKARLEAQPGSILTRHLLGLLAEWTGDFETAATLQDPTLQAALRSGASEEDSASILLRAREFKKLGQPGSAYPLLTHILLSEPRHTEALWEVAECLQAEGRHEEAAGFFRAICRTNPQHPRAFYHLGLELLCSRSPAAAIAPLHHATALTPNWHMPWRHLAMALIQNGRHTEAALALHVCCELAPDDSVSLSQYILSLHYCPEHQQKNLPELYRRFASRTRGNLPPQSDPPGLGDKIKIGYVSGDFYEHPVAAFIEPVLRLHNRDAFELHAYSNGSRRDETTSRLQSLFNHWCDTGSLSDSDFVHKVQSDGIHVLVDLSGHTPLNRLAAFALRPAPVQVSMIGTMFPTGLPEMDFRISDAFLTPSGKSPPGMEKPLLLRSGAVCFQPPAEAPPVAPQPFSSGTPFTFASLNDPGKVTEEVLAVWIEILKRAPDTRLLFVRRPGSAMMQHFRKGGIAEDRLIEMDFQPFPEFLRLHSRVDLALDPFPYNGLTVTLQGCWMGVVPLTLAGHSPPARAAGMILHRMGLEEFITHTKEEYIEKAVSLSAAPHSLAALRLQLRERTKDAWCDAAAYTREFEEQIKAQLICKQSPPCPGAS